MGKLEREVAPKLTNPLPPSSVPTTEGAAERVRDLGALARTSAEGDAQVPSAPEVTDEELFRRGDRESLTTLVRRHQSSLFSLLVHMTGGDASLADDLFQETFVRAVRSAKTFDTSRSFRTWLAAIALNLVRDEVRKRKSRGEVALTKDQAEERPGTTASEHPSASLEQQDEAARVREALARLTDKEREIVLLHFYEGLTLVEAAGVLSVPVGTAKSRLHGALARLKTLLRP
jgi:RNA polymerase sigma-70 factor (ECF subfamily)